MKQFRSEHYIFHFREDSVAEKDILAIAEQQEICFSFISSALNTIPDFLIEYFLCDTPEEVGKAYGDNEPCDGFAREPNQIYAVYNEHVQCIGFHEDAHLISYCINQPKSAAVREGLAMFFDRKWWGIHNSDWTSHYMKAGLYIPVDKLLQDEVFETTDCTISYPIMGAFTEYLIARYGIERYLQFYRRKDNAIRAMEEIYEMPMCRLNDDFMDYITLLPSDSCTGLRIAELLTE